MVPRRFAPQLFIVRSAVAIALFLLPIAVHPQQRTHRWGVRLAVSNEGAPAVGVEYFGRINRYLAVVPSIESSAGENGPWFAADAVVEVPIGSDHGIWIGGGIVSVVGERRADQGRIIAPEAILFIGGRGYGFAKVIGTEEQRVALGGGFRW